MPQLSEPVQKTQKQKKNKGFLALKIIIAIILIIAILATIFIGVVTRKRKDTDPKAVFVGDMLTSDTINYRSSSADGIRHNPVIKMGEVIWSFCSSSDAEVHKKQTPPDVTVKKDIPYIDDSNLYHKLDVYYPKNIKDNEKLPVIIDVHGGGWMYATKELNENYCKALANRGFVVFCMSYRLVPDVTVKDQLFDVMSALDYISKNMDSYSCDKENIMLTGDSAGGMMSAYSTVLLQSAELQKVFEVPSVDMDITALLLTSPVANMKDGAMSVYMKPLWGKNYKKSEIYKYMNFDEIYDFAKEFPPTYLITSDGDSIAKDQTIHTSEFLKSKGVKVTLKNYPDYKGESLPHVFSVLEPFDEIGTQTIDEAIDFFNKTIAEKNAK